MASNLSLDSVNKVDDVDTHANPRGLHGNPTAYLTRCQAVDKRVYRLRSPRGGAAFLGSVAVGDGYCGVEGGAGDHRLLVEYHLVGVEAGDLSGFLVR